MAIFFGFLPFLAMTLALNLSNACFNIFFTHIEWIYAGSALVQVQIKQLGHDGSPCMWSPNMSSLSSFPTLNERI